MIDWVSSSVVVTPKGNRNIRRLFSPSVTLSTIKPPKWTGLGLNLGIGRWRRSQWWLLVESCEICLILSNRTRLAVCVHYDKWMNNQQTRSGEKRLLYLCFDGVCLNITFQGHGNDEMQGFRLRLFGNRFPKISQCKLKKIWWELRNCHVRLCGKLNSS
jgi:hypothetical protein